MSVFVRDNGLHAGLWVMLVSGVVLASCGGPRKFPDPPEAERLAVLADNEAYRKAQDSSFRSAPDSPFRLDSSITFHGLRWFPVDARFRVRSILHRYEVPETVTVLGTKGEVRREIKYGYFAFTLPDSLGNAVPLRLNVYKFSPYDKERYRRFPTLLNVWFRDRTTGKETYGVGRYVEVGEESGDSTHEYEIDFNKSYNPYCAYSARYSCAVPREEDFLNIALSAGERNYHD